jgi:hypothetical protein
MSIIQVPVHYYRQFDAELEREVPAEAYGGWNKTELPLDPNRTAVVVMHAWDCGEAGQYPGAFRAVEYLPRSYEISRNIFPGLLAAVRGAGIRLFHVVGGKDYYSGYPGFKQAVRLAGEEPPMSEQINHDDSYDHLQEFRRNNVFPGIHNCTDNDRSVTNLRFLPEAEPQGSEGVAATSKQLFALCRHYGINHLIYTGFAIDGCLLLSPGGMADMNRHGILCSAVRQAVTAIENKESARREVHKEVALWRVALIFGFVYDADDLIRAFDNLHSSH